MKDRKREFRRRVIFAIHENRIGRVGTFIITLIIGARERTVFVLPPEIIRCLGRLNGAAVNGEAERSKSTCRANN